MSDATYGTFSYSARENARRNRKGLNNRVNTSNSASGARHRFEQRRKIQQVDAINALVAEVVASVKPRNDVSEDEELALKAKRGQSIM
jgi:hypothetical protein